MLSEFAVFSGEHQFRAGRGREEPEDALTIAAPRGGVCGFTSTGGDHSRPTTGNEAAGEARTRDF